MSYRGICEKHGPYFGDFCAACGNDAEAAMSDDEWFKENLPAIRLAAIDSLRAEINSAHELLDELGVPREVPGAGDREFTSVRARIAYLHDSLTGGTGEE